MSDDFFRPHPGEVPAPVPGGPLLCAATAGVRRIHRVFLWAYDEAPGLARSAEPGDTDRSAYVGDALRTFDRILAVHHEAEDRFMYPRLRERAPACALHVDQMLAQHAEVTAQLQALAPVRDGWARTAEPALGERLAGQYERLAGTLAVHLRREVTEVTPAVEKVLTPKEFDELAGHGMSEFETKVVLAYLGIILATNPPGEREEFFKDVPVPVRLLYRLVGRRLYRKQYATLFPGREIPETV